MAQKAKKHYDDRTTIDSGGFGVYNKLSIYPNPSDHLLNIKYSGELNQASLRIYNIQGAVMMNQKLNSNHTTLDISDLSPGVYYLALNTGNKMIYNKIVKQ